MQDASIPKTGKRRTHLDRKVPAAENEQHRPVDPAPSSLNWMDGGESTRSPGQDGESPVPGREDPGGVGIDSVQQAPPRQKANFSLKKEPIKQVSLQRRTIGERIAGERHERALDRWAQQQAEWEAFRGLACAKTGRQPADLVVTRMEEHRERIEVMELLDAATPLEDKSGGNSWYHSLRGDGTRLVQVGNMFSGLYLPVKVHKENYVREIVRRPLLRELHEHRNLQKVAEGGLKHKTWRDQEYMLNRMLRYQNKMSELTPGKLGFHETLDLDIVGCRLKPSDAEQSCASGLAGGEAQGGGLDHELEGSAAAEDITALHALLTERQPEMLLGPHIEAVPSRLQFRAQVGAVSTLSVTLRNVGTAAVSYEWRMNPSVHGFQESILPDDPTSRFGCQVTKGTILPRREINHVFSFCSKAPGVFFVSWRLHTYPELLTPITNITMHGIALEDDLVLERREVFREKLFKEQILHQVQEIIEDIVEAVKLDPQSPPDLTRESVQERLFSERNDAQGLYWTPHAWEQVNLLSTQVDALSSKQRALAAATQHGKPSKVATGPSSEAREAPRAQPRGRLPVKKPAPSPQPRPPEELVPSPALMLRDLSLIPSVERGALAEASKAELEIFEEKQALNLAIPRAIRAARVRPLEKSPIWYAAYEAVSELVLSVPRFSAHARLVHGLEPLHFICPPSEASADPAAQAAFESKLEARRKERAGEGLEKPSERKEKETKAAETFEKIFAKHRFVPGVCRFEGLAREATMVAAIRDSARVPSFAERLAPYTSRMTSESMEMGGNVAIFEADLGFLGEVVANHKNDPTALRTPEVMERVKGQLQGLTSILEANPLAVLIVAHVGTPAPDSAPNLVSAASAPEGGGTEDSPIQRIRDQDASWLGAVSERMQGLVSLEHIVDAVREAAELATSVEFVPHNVWLSDTQAFAQRVRSDVENKVFLLENLSAIPEELGIQRIFKAAQKKVAEEPPPVVEPPKGQKAKAKEKEPPKEEPPKEEEPAGICALRVPWYRRERWAERFFEALAPEVIVIDSMTAACSDFTLHTGFWPAAPLRVTGTAVEAELQALQETLQTIAGGESGEAPDPDSPPRKPAPLLMAIGGGGYGRPGGEAELLKKLQLLVGLAQLPQLSPRDGGIFFLGGELAVCILADIFGLRLGVRSFVPSAAGIAAIRETLLEVLGRRRVPILLPIDFACEEPPPPPPEPVEPPPDAKPAKGGKEPAAAKAKAAAAAAEAPPPPPPPPPDPNDPSCRPLVALRGALAAAARTPVSLGYLDGLERCLVLDPSTGELTAAIGSPADLQGARSTPSPPPHDADGGDAPANEEASEPPAPPADVMAPVPTAWKVRDIGDETIEGLLLKLKRCRGLLWNGVLGYWEGGEQFQKGTRRLLAALEERFAEDEEEEAEDEDEDDDARSTAPKKEKPEPDADFEVALVVGTHSPERVYTLMETPSLVSFVSKTGDALLRMFRGEPLPGLLACAPRPPS